MFFDYIFNRSRDSANRRQRVPKPRGKIVVVKCNGKITKYKINRYGEVKKL